MEMILLIYNILKIQIIKFFNLILFKIILYNLIINLGYALIFYSMKSK